MSEYSPGLEGIIAGKTAISCVNEETGGLSYRGYGVEELAEKASFEEVAHLLIRGHLPTQSELDAFCGTIMAHTHIPLALIDILRHLPVKAHPMDALRTGVSALGPFDPDVADNGPEANERKAIRLLAQMPTIVSIIGRNRQDQPPVGPVDGLTFIQNFFHMLGMKMPGYLACKVFGVSLILYAEHEFNNSAFAARTVASSLSDMHSAVAAAIGALKGPLHGGANEAVMHMLLEIGETNRVESWLKDKLAKKERIMGFGHRIYKQNEDSRSTIIKGYNKMLAEHLGNTKWYEMSERLEALMLKEKGLHPNLDFYTASAYHLMDLPIELYTPIFVMSRVTGWATHVMEQHANNRLIRPTSEYIGPTGLKYGN
ncbi:MAG: citrate synthase [Nitrospirota bacterium]|nr:citrate synthase [Nitrospirota bacterium]